MKIGLLIYGELDQRSGGYLYDRKLVEHLRAQGDEVEVLSLPVGGYFRHLLDNFSSSLLERLECLELDLLLQDELNHPSLFALNRRLKRRLRLPIIAIVHHLRSQESHPPGLRQVYARLERRYLGTVDALIYNSQSTRRSVEQLLKRRPPGVVVYPAADHRASAPHPPRLAAGDGQLRLFFLGNVIRRKGLHDLLEALRILPSSDWRLRVGGDLALDRGYVRRLRRMLPRAGLESRVEFCGHLDPQEISQSFAWANLFVLPSQLEGFGIAYLEAMAAGVPVIASRSGGAVEIVDHQVNGLLIEPGDPAALAAVLADLLQETERLREMGRAARQRYQRHPTWAESAQEARDFLTNLLTADIELKKEETHVSLAAAHLDRNPHPDHRLHPPGGPQPHDDRLHRLN